MSKEIYLKLIIFVTISALGTYLRIQRLSPAACLGIADSLVLAFLDPSVGIHTTKTNNLYDICQIFQI